MDRNLMKPALATINNVYDETPDIKTFNISFKKKRLQDKFLFLPGKFVELSVFGVGEMPLGISSSPYNTDSIEVTVANVGRISNALHQMKKGDTVGLRGPFGRGFPINRFRRKDIIFIAGGLGMVPLRSAMKAVLYKREHFGQFHLFYGARNPAEICYKRDCQNIEKRKDMNLYISVDSAPRSWKGKRGFVTDLLGKVELPTYNSVALICGPPIMIKIAAEKLREKGIDDSRIYLSLERLMHCGVGKCAHCNIGDKQVCIDGPVFNYREIEELLRGDL